MFSLLVSACALRKAIWVRIALAQLNPTVGAMADNGVRLLRALDEARTQGADLVLAPELYVAGYPPLDLLERDRFIALCEEAEARIVSEMPEGIVCIFGNLTRRPAPHGRGLHNSAVCVKRGEVLLRAHKTLLPVYDVFDEARYFEPGDASERGILEVNGTRVGVTVCEDLWNDKTFWEKRLYAHDPVEHLVERGAEVIVNLSSSPWCRGKASQRREIFGHTAKKHGVVVAAVNQVGANDGLIFDGRSLVFAADGKLIHQAPAWRESMTTVDTERTNEVTPSPEDDVEQIAQALELGIRDYFDKCGVKRAVIALSGGIDSAVTAYLAVRALGADRVTGLALPSQYSSEGSVTDAEALAKNLGIRLHQVSIEPTFQAALEGLRDTFENRPPDVTEENVQSRIRGLMIMALANKQGALALTTGNKSEAAVGYCTLYGDTNGGLAPLADLYKHQVYALARFANREREIIPVSTIDKPPSAELRPDQKDEDSLPPYDVLDEVLRLLIEERKTVPEIAEATGQAETLVRELVHKVHRNEFKRKQFAVTLRVSPKAWVGRVYPVAHRFSE